MLDEAAEIGDDREARLKDGSAAYAVSSRPRAELMRQEQGRVLSVNPAGIRQRLPAADGMVVWIWKI